MRDHYRLSHQGRFSDIVQCELRPDKETQISGSRERGFQIVGPTRTELLRLKGYWCIGVIRGYCVVAAQ